MKLVLICDEKKIFDGEVSEVHLNTENGPVTILPKHQPYMSRINGEVSYTPIDGTVSNTKISEGFVYTDGDVCFVVVDL